jgi:anti-anti-sigma factor
MISISARADGVLVALQGQVHPDLLNQVLTDVTDERLPSHVVIDLREAATIGDPGVEAISGASERVRRRRGTLVLCSPHRGLRRALARRGLDVEPV